MRKFIRIAFPSGHVYEVPASAVAEDRVNYYVVASPERTREQIAHETLELFKSDFNLFDWAKNNMNWSDLAKFARMVSFNPPNFGQQWDDAELTTSDEPNAVLDIATLGEASVTAPLEMAIHQVVASGEQACMFVFQQPETKLRTSAIIAIAGEQDAVDGYLAVLEQFDSFMQKQKATAGVAGY